MRRSFVTFNKPPKSLRIDAWGRRITGYWQRMPATMRVLFHLAMAATSIRYLTCTILIVALLLIQAQLVFDSSLFAGIPPVTENALLTPFILIAAGYSLFMWVVPFVLNFTVQTWYHCSRGGFE